MKNISNLEENGWKLEGEHLIKNFVFKNFNNAFSFLTSVALDAENANHHPKITNEYNKVEISLTTHDQKKLTQKDVDLAIKIEKTSQLFLN